ncbi:hypothetical protein BDQ17DRAFT_1352880 [Cyathus striatus]|nr:hypothetical protein BDQ17DRAFT_1352880 [Cyathus striatus]
MGRALFSHSYPSAPVVRTEPEPVVDRCERWSVTNPFDPDSDEFFSNAEYEAFIDPVQFASQQSQGESLVVVDGPSDTSSSENSPTDAVSPMAIGPDDPAVLLDHSFTATEWQQLLETDSAESELLRDRPYPTSRRALSILAQRSASSGQSTEQNNATIEALRVNRPRSLSLLPPSLPTSIRNAGAAESNAASSPLSPIIIRPANLTPLNIPVNVSSTPSPMTPETPSPSTSSAQTSQFTPMQMITPSPPTTVSPRVYSWQRHAIPAIPTSPTLARYRDGPLTSTRPRMPITRIEVVPARIRVQGTVM